MVAYPAFLRLMNMHIFRMSHPQIKREATRFIYKRVIRTWRKVLWNRSHGLMLALSSVAGFSYQSEQQQVSDEETGNQQNFDVISKQGSNDEWECVYEGSNIKVLRRIVKDQDVYEYRCFGSYDDISAAEFIDAQFDNDYRLSWDKNILYMQVLREDDEADSQVIKWVSKFPYPMYHRLYIFVRTKIVEEENKKVTVVCKALDQKEYPNGDSSHVRVTNYSSKLVVWAHKSFDEDGLSYLLTYREDPKSSVPSFAYNYIVNRTGPSFMDMVHSASLKLKSNKPEKVVVDEKQSADVDRAAGDSKKISKKDDLPIDVECVEQTVKIVVEDPKKSSTAGGNISESTKTSAKEDEESTIPNSC